MKRNTVVVLVIIVLVIGVLWCRSALVRTPEERIQPPAAEERPLAPN